MKTARAAKREKLKKAATEKALQAANVSAGLLPADAVAHAEWRRRMDRKVTFTPDLPELDDIGLRVDGVVYLHGFPNTPPGEGHWNARGHAAAARLVAGWLCGGVLGRHLAAPAPLGHNT